MAGGSEDLAALEIVAQLIGVVLRVPSVAQQSELQASVAQGALAVPMLPGQWIRRVLGFRILVYTVRKTPAVFAAVTTFLC